MRKVRGGGRWGEEEGWGRRRRKGGVGGVRWGGGN